MIYLIGIGDLGVPTEYIFTMVGAKTGADYIINHDDYVAEEVDKILAATSEESLVETARGLDIPIEFAYTILQMGEGNLSTETIAPRKKKYLLNFYGRARIAHNPRHWTDKILEFTDENPDKKVVLINLKSAIEFKEGIYTEDSVVIRLLIADGKYDHFDGEKYNYFERNQAIHNEFRFFHTVDTTIVCNSFTLEETIEETLRAFLQVVKK